MSLRILVTGANGFLGSRLIKTLLNKEDIFVCGIYRHGVENLVKTSCKNLVYIRCDLTEKTPISAIFQRYHFDAVIHTAASISSSNGYDYTVKALRDNVITQVNLVSESLECHSQRYIYCSTISVYDSSNKKEQGFVEEDLPGPNNVYGWSKYIAEEILRIPAQCQFHMKSFTLRLSGIHGPGRQSGVVYTMIRSALSGKPISIDELKSRFRFLFVDDAVQAILLTLFSKPTEPHKCYNVAGKEIYTLGELAKEIFDLTGSSCHIDYHKTGRIRDQVLDIAKIQKELGFRPRSLKENMSAIINEVKREFCVEKSSKGLKP